MPIDLEDRSAAQSFRAEVKHESRGHQAGNAAERGNVERQKYKRDIIREARRTDSVLKLALTAFKSGCMTGSEARSKQRALYQCG